jgi:hypothetical protein
MMSAGWYGEGDDFFFIDGEAEPSLRGTGTEDYFCDGWGFREQDGPFYGTPLWEGLKAGDRCTAYRFHLTDPIVFTKSLLAEIEHKGSQRFPQGKGTGYIERDDLMSSVALWYQSEPHKPWPALPPGPTRLPFTETKLVVGWQATNQTNRSKGAIETPNLRKATGNKFLLFQPTEDKPWLEFRFTTEKEQIVQLVANLIHQPDAGNYRVSLDGKELGTVNLYGSEQVFTPHSFGMLSLAGGEHVLRFEGVGRVPIADGFALGVDALVARVPVYSRPLDFDLRKIQK